MLQLRVWAYPEGGKVEGNVGYYCLPLSTHVLKESETVQPAF